MRSMMITLVFLLYAGFMSFMGCFEDDTGDTGSGACVQSYGIYWWCHELDEATCHTIGDYEYWTGGSCSSVGYSSPCPGGSWVKPGGTCL